ncbi:MAG TPA: TetR/AcrR family transcriptional regulator [Euryarchaeota archaeon]|nr:TetR/AcrR family transcriptional regulator [Euryarchaeota archaeon]
MVNNICKQSLTYITMRGKRPTKGRKRRARERILDSALVEFGRNGYSGATTRGIAARAEVNEVTVFRNFGSKKELFKSVLRERFPLEDIRRTVLTDVEMPIDELLANNMKGVLRVLRANKHMLMVIFSDVWKFPEMRKALYEIGFRQGIEFLSELMEAQMRAGRIKKMDPQIAARSIMGMIQGYFMINDLLGGSEYDEKEEERFIRGLVSIYLDGARGKRGGATHG